MNLRINRSQSNVRESLLKWCKSMTIGYNVEIDNFTSDWADGLAFCALIDHFIPNEFEFDSLNKENRKINLELAFSTA